MTGSLLYISYGTNICLAKFFAEQLYEIGTWSRCSHLGQIPCARSNDYSADSLYTKGGPDYFTQ